MNGEITVHNAGLVLFNPFLPRLFSQFDLTDPDGFKNTADSAHAVFLLEHMVSGNTDGSATELSKLLCGLETSALIAGHPELTRQESDTVNRILQAVIRQWGRLGGTSLESFRSSFLAREGVLYRETLQDDIVTDDSVPKDSACCWHLRIEPKPYDILLDSLPWSYTPIRYSWMPLPLFVQWRI